jgi:hypothetical protein
MGSEWETNCGTEKSGKGERIRCRRYKRGRKKEGRMMSFDLA